MVALSYFHKSNAYTLAAIWNTSLLTSTWQADHFALARSMLGSFLAPPQSP
jgi:hypothetical protein